MIPMIGTEKRKVGARPTFRASALAKYAGAVGTGVTVTVPATAVVGDFAVVGVSCRDDTRTIATAPAGWTKVYDTRDWVKSVNATGTSTPDGLAVYTKRIASGDAGSSLTFKASGTGSESLVAAVGVYSGVDHIAVAPKGRTHYGGSYASKTPLLHTTSVGPQNLVVGFIATRQGGTDYNASHALLTSIPSGYTMRENDSVGVALQNATGLSLHDGSTHGWDEETSVVAPYDTYLSWTHVAMELAGPDANGWFENERFPKSIQGKPIYVYGTSNTCMVKRTNIDAITLTTYGDEPKWTQQESYPDWIISIGDPSHLGNHMGVGGTVSTDATTFAFGSHTGPTQACDSKFALLTDTLVNTQVGTWKTQTNRDMGGLVLLDIFGNDILGEATPTSQVRDGATIAADALVRLCRSKSVVAYNYNVGTDTVFVGSWANQTSDGCDNGGHGRTLTPGDYVELTITDPVVELLVLAVDSAKVTAGASFSVSVDGVTVHTDTTNDRMLRGGSSSPQPDYGYVQMAIPLTVGPGTHTVRITHTGASGTSLRYAGYLVPKTVDAEIPWIVLMGMQQMPIGTGVQPAATLAAYVAIAETVAARFPSKVLVYDPMANGQWSRQGQGATHGPAGTPANSFSLDAIHMNLKGHAFFAMDLLRFLNERIP